MKIIVTKQNIDGTYDECGMCNRALFKVPDVARGYKAARRFAQGSAVRVEYFHDADIYRNPFTTVYLPKEDKS